MLPTEAAGTASLMSSLVAAGTITGEYSLDAKGTSPVVAGTILWLQAYDTGVVDDH